MSLMLTGVGVSRGIAIGPVRILHEIQPTLTRRKIDRRRIRGEVSRFRRAVADAIKDTQAIRGTLTGYNPEEFGAFLDGHLLILDDPGFSQPVIELIRKEAYSCEWALSVHRDHLRELFLSIDDPYLRARRDDVENAVSRVLRKLASASGTEAVKSHGRQPGFVLVTSDLAPADLIANQHSGVAGIVTRHGSSLSHSTIVARSLGIPVVASTGDALRLVCEGDSLLVDGDAGMVVANPDRSSLTHYRRVRKEVRLERKLLTELRNVPALTRDRHAVELQANVESNDELRLARNAGAEGIGLFRTEALYLNRERLPDEEEQLNVYRQALKAMKGAPVTIRTVDIWASRRVPGLDAHINTSPQPALGLRGIRLCLRHPDLFKTQIRALLRASAYGPLRVLLPMVSSVSEVRNARRIIGATLGELADQGLRFNPRIPVGVMVETPAAAVCARMLCQHVNFLAIGSNDLLQYTLAIDRADEAVQHLYDPLHPSVLRLIFDIVRAAQAGNVPVALCGEMAGDAKLTRLLLGLGLREFSAHPVALLEVKKAIIEADVSAVRTLARRMLDQSDPDKSRALLERINGLS
ncbi:MAG: phosphoenolpyruvate--protein phosphotransferase [Pseudomonadota bacterium]